MRDITQIKTNIKIVLSKEKVNTNHRMFPKYLWFSDCIHRKGFRDLAVSSQSTQRNNFASPYFLVDSPDMKHMFEFLL